MAIVTAEAMKAIGDEIAAKRKGAPPRVWCRRFSLQECLLLHNPQAKQQFTPGGGATGGALGGQHPRLDPDLSTVVDAWRTGRLSAWAGPPSWRFDTW